FGPDHVPANHSQAPENDREKGTNGTFGQSFTDLSPSAILQSFLENKLQARLDVNGSPEYALTWKRWDMPSGRRSVRCGRRRAAYQAEAFLGGRRRGRQIYRTNHGKQNKQETPVI